MTLPPLAVLGYVHAAILVFATLVLMADSSRRWRVLVAVWAMVTAVAYVFLSAAWLARALQTSSCELCRYFVPPYSNYLYQESFGKLGAYFGVNLASGLLFGAAFWWFARRTRGEVIDRDDVFLLTLAGVMIGWPNILLFLAALFFLSVVVFLAKRRFRDRVTNPRVIITPLIPFAALPIILWGDWLAARLGFYDLGLVALTLVKP